MRAFGGKDAYACQNSGVVNDFIQWLHSAGAVMIESFFGQFVEPTRGNIVINLLVPPLVEILLKPGSDSTRVLKRHFAQGIFNFCDCAHDRIVIPQGGAGKLGEAEFNRKATTPGATTYTSVPFTFKDEVHFAFRDCYENLPSVDSPHDSHADLAIGLLRDRFGRRPLILRCLFPKV